MLKCTKFAQTKSLGVGAGRRRYTCRQGACCIPRLANGKGRDTPRISTRLPCHPLSGNLTDTIRRLLLITRCVAADFDMPLHHSISDGVADLGSYCGEKGPSGKTRPSFLPQTFAKTRPPQWQKLDRRDGIFYSGAVMMDSRLIFGPW